MTAPTPPEQPDTEAMEPETEDGAAGDSGAGDADAETE